MQNCSNFYGAAIATLTLLNTNGTMAQTNAVPASKAPSEWVKSLKITVVKVPETDTSELLGLKMWHVSIIAPRSTRHANFIVEAEEAGKPVQRLANVRLDSQQSWPMNGRLSIFVGQYPLYDSQGEAARARYQVRINGFQTTPLMNLGEISSSAVADNPLDGSNARGYDHPQRRPDGSFELISGYSFALRAHNGPSNTPLIYNGPPNVALIFRVKEEPN